MRLKRQHFMNEAEWLECGNPEPMLQFLRGKVSSRKLRLFAVGCCRRIWRLLKDDRSRAAVAASESFADNRIRRPGLVAAQQQGMLGNKRFDEYVYPAENAAASVARPSVIPRWVAQLTTWAVSNESIVSAGTVAARHANRADAERKETLAQAALLRCIVGNPFRPVTISPAWLTPTVVRLAQATYDERAFDRLPILADALEDAGCDQADVLSHCRQPGEHVRGCFVVDLLLGRS
jgi:hypothetical protein